MFELCEWVAARHKCQVSSIKWRTSYKAHSIFTSCHQPKMFTLLQCVSAVPGICWASFSIAVTQYSTLSCFVICALFCFVQQLTFQRTIFMSYRLSSHFLTSNRPWVGYFCFGFRLNAEMHFTNFTQLITHIFIVKDHKTWLNENTEHVNYANFV